MSRTLLYHTSIETHDQRTCASGAGGSRRSEDDPMCVGESRLLSHLGILSSSCLPGISVSLDRARVSSSFLIPLVNVPVLVCSFVHLMDEVPDVSLEWIITCQASLPGIMN